MFEVLKIWLILRDQPLQETEHIALHVRIRIFIYRQAAGSMLGKEDTNPIAASRQTILHLAGHIYHLFAVIRPYAKLFHILILLQITRLID